MTENTLSKSEMDLIVSKIMDIDSQKITEIIEKKRSLTFNHLIHYYPNL